MMRPKSSAENPSVDEEEDFITEKKKKRRKVPQIKRPPTVMKVKEVLAVPEPPAVREPLEVKSRFFPLPASACTRISSLRRHAGD